MNWVTNIMNYVQGNWSDLIQIYFQIIGVASIIVKLTPTIKDDNILKGIIRFIGKYVALNRESEVK